MLTPATPFPFAGSYGLTIDTDLPPARQRGELVRILRIDGSSALVAFPLRANASGNKTVPLADLIDGTPLTDAEQRDLRGLDRELFGRVARTAAAKAKARHREALRARERWAPLMGRLLADADRLNRVAA